MSANTALMSELMLVLKPRRVASEGRKRAIDALNGNQISGLKRVRIAVGRECASCRLGEA